MLLPTEQAASTYLTDFMRGFVRDIEERQQEERKKAEGKREDKQQEALKAQIRPDESTAAANAKINAHFFGALKRDENPMATLISNFADALGLAQGSDESAGDFADRLATAVAFTRLVSRERKSATSGESSASCSAGLGPSSHCAGVVIGRWGSCHHGA